ncbi:MAG TPA: PQQ-binding-like beta-propeller repeat protein, partial [Gemmataceae bacterium]|nr:PQQ-binding-like beta-propeller repeat protein [Gemmataceae bacterium]
GKEPEKTDITAEVRRLNADASRMPPKEFRKGHVTPRPFDAASIKKTELGFEIQLPSKAPVPTPTVYEGKVYVSGGFHSKEYYCFDAVTGKLVWAVNLDDDGPTSAVCADGVCIFNTESCTIFALDVDTGKQLWSYWLGDPLTSTPTIANGKVFTSYPIGGRAGGGLKDGPGQGANKNSGAGVTPKMPEASHVFACLEIKTGVILWQRWIDSDIMSASVAVGDDVYATSFAGTIYKFKQADGLVLSAHRSRATSAPVIVAGNVYLTQRADNGKDGKTEERIAAVDKQGEARAGFEGFRRPAEYLDGKVQDRSAVKKGAVMADAANGLGTSLQAVANAPAAYKNVGQGNISTMQAFQGSRILNYGGNNFNCMGNEVLCTDPADGKVRWSVKLDGNLEKVGGFLASAPAAAGGKIFLATIQGELLQIDPASGKIEVRYKIGSPVRAQPAIEHGRAYVGTTDGKLVCIDTGHSEFTGWSTWGANAAHTNLTEKHR